MENTPIPPGTIVVGVDGSPSASRALDWAITQARLQHRPLTLAHGLDAARTVWLDPVGGADHGAIRDAQLDDARTFFARARDKVAERHADLVVHEALRLVDPRMALLELAEHAAMVVVGSRGRGPVRSLLLGSVGAAVSRHAACPVVVVRPGNAGAVRNGVLVGADGSPDSLATVEFAYRQAALHDVPLTILHCAWEWRPGEHEEEARIQAVEPLSGLAEKFPEVRARVEIAHDDPAEHLVRESQRMDLVVVGAHHGNRLSAMVYGSVAQSVVEHAACPVAVTPVAAAGQDPVRELGEDNGVRAVVVTGAVGPPAAGDGIPG